MAFEYPWPHWLDNIFSSWLEETGYPASGVGDLHDLRLYVATGESSRWVGLINTGWFYHNNKEQYNYVLRGETLATVSAGSGQATHSVSFRPTWGPVLVSSSVAASGDYPYIQHANSFYPGRALSWSLFSSSAGVYVATIPVSSVLIGMRNLTNLPLGSVAGSGQLISENLYSYNPATRQVFIKPKTPSDITIYADLLYNQPILRMRELVVQEDSGVRASYRDLTGVQVIRGGQTYNVPTDVVSGFITHTLTGLSTGDWVILDYWIKHSYIVKDHQTVQFYTTSASGDSMRIHYEQSIPDLIPALSLNATGAYYSGVLNVNPLHSDGHRAGYLFHALPSTPASSIWPVTQVKVALDRESFNKSWNQPVKVTVLCLGANDLPVPWAPLSLSVSSSASVLTATPNTSRADGKGEFHALIVPASGGGNFEFWAVSALSTGYASALAITTTTVLPNSIYTDGHVSVVITDQKTSRGYWRGFANKTYLDGIPVAADGFLLQTKLASPIEYQDKVVSGRVTLNSSQNPENISSIVEFGYLPQSGDELAVSHEGGQSTVIETEDE